MAGAKRRGSGKGSAASRKKKRSSVASSTTSVADEPTQTVAKGLEAMADEYAKLGDVDMAARCLQAAVATAPDGSAEGARAALRLGELLEDRTGRAGDAVALLGKAVAALPSGHPERYRAAVRLAELRECEGNVAAAAAALESVLDVGDDDDSASAAAPPPPWLYLCLIRRSALLRAAGDDDAAAEQLNRGVSLAEAAGDEHTLAVLRLQLARQWLDHGDLDAAERELEAAGVSDDDPPAGFMTLAGIAHVLRLELLSRQHAGTDKLRSTVNQLHTLMKRLNPAAEDAAGTALRWVTRKQLIALAYLASIVATTTLGSLREARGYASHALDALQRQRPRGAAADTVRGRIETMVADDLYLPLLDQCVSLRLGVNDFAAAQRFLIEGVELLKQRPARYAAWRSVWRMRVAQYLDATGESLYAEQHLASGAAGAAARSDEAVAALLARAMLALRDKGDIADRLAEIAEAAADDDDAEVSPDAALVSQYVIGLRRMMAGEFDQAIELLRAKGYKHVSKRLHALALSALAMCYREEGVADSAYERVAKAAASMDDPTTRLCAHELTDGDEKSTAAVAKAESDVASGASGKAKALTGGGSKAELEASRKTAVAEAIALPGHATLLELWLGEEPDLPQ